MSPIDNPPRIDARSQWLSTTVADLDRQQDPQSAPPRAVELDEPNLSDPLGSREEGRNMAPQAAQGDAPPVMAGIGGLQGGTSPVVMTAVQSVMAPNATLGVTPAAQHAGSTSQDDAPATSASALDAPAPGAFPQGAAAPPALASAVDLPMTASPSVAPPSPAGAAETALQAFEDHIHTLMDPIVGAPAPQSLIASAIDTVFDRLHAGASQPSSDDDENDDPLLNDLLDAAHAELIATATSLLGAFASQLGQSDEHDADQAFDDAPVGQTGLSDIVIQGPSPAHFIDKMTADLVASHPSLAAPLNHDFDPHHLLG